MKNDERILHIATVSMGQVSKNEIVSKFKEPDKFHRLKYGLTNLGIHKPPTGISLRSRETPAPFVE